MPSKLPLFTAIKLTYIARISDINIKSFLINLFVPIKRKNISVIIAETLTHTGAV